jgi:activator of HSP90 ATPase
MVEKYHKREIQGWNDMKNRTEPFTVPTRRQALAGLVAMVGSLSVATTLEGKAQQKMQESQSAGVEGLLTYLHQEVEIQATPQRIYEALMDAKQFAAATGMEAQISRDAGGAFSTFGGLIGGRNVELVPNQRIVQAWRPGDWEPGVYSLVKFEFKPRASHTEIILDHTGFPEGNFRHLNSGWYLRYWEPLRKYLA